MAVSSIVSSSCATFTVTVCAVLQLLDEKIRLAGSAVTSVLTDGSLIVTVTLAVGWLSSLIVYVPEPPSSMVRPNSETVTPATSSSSMLTVAVAVAPAVTRGGSVPKPSSTLSPSSTIMSSVGVNVNVCSVSPELNIKFAGTPE